MSITRIMAMEDKTYFCFLCLFDLLLCAPPLVLGHFWGSHIGGGGTNASLNQEMNDNYTLKIRKGDKLVKRTDIKQWVLKGSNLTQRARLAFD